MPASSSPVPDSSPLLHNLLLFARVLRGLGIRVTADQMGELATALGWIDIRNKGEFRDTARALLVKRREDGARFDTAFDLFWRAWAESQGEIEGAVVHRLVRESERAQPRSENPGPAAHGSDTESTTIALAVGEEQDDGEDDGEPALTLYSAREVLRHKDFALFNEAEIDDARRFLAALQWALVHRRSRRRRPARRGRHLDMRRSFRHSLRHGGELLHLARRGPKPRRRRLVLICDISGSMERYTRLLLHFLYTVESNIQQAEVFVFGTRLTRITPELRHRDPDTALRAVAGRVQDWSGGTRIGESLGTFNRVWARRVLGQGAIVLIISDGWDRGDPDLLAREMTRLQRASYRLIWLNPLLGTTGYQPLTQGIQAALPYVDNFLPAHNLQSLEALAHLLNQMQHGRPERRQQPEKRVSTS